MTKKRAPSKKRDIPWEQVYDYLLVVGQEHDPYRFAVKALDELGELIPFDQGLVWCLDENRHVVEQHLINIHSRWTVMYIEYYSQLEGDRRSLRGTAYEKYGMPHVDQIIWAHEPETEFIRNYIMERGVTCSLTTALFDLNGLPRVVFSLDRTRSERFSEQKVELMSLLASQLANLYKNFFVSPYDIPGKRRSDSDAMVAHLLTKREREVVDLMCQGFSPAHVATSLHISTATAYKDIAHIYKKLHVSSQQELLVRVLGKR